MWYDMIKTTLQKAGETGKGERSGNRLDTVEGFSNKEETESNSKPQYLAYTRGSVYESVDALHRLRRILSNPQHDHYGLPLLSLIHI